ncbi:MAG TPA: BMP family ABC transporter substrate-binding protein [Acidimicrobiales bacterium]|nr:BMP family ABC transporter substrate-binding protein [Acidimicrobiales bacterium]
MSTDDVQLVGGPPARRAWKRPVAALTTLTLVASMGLAAIATSSGAAARHTELKRAPASSSFLACEVTDTGGINDRSFNASAYQGLLLAAKEDSAIQPKYLSSTSESDYVPNINTFIGEKCGIIVTVGFLMGNATADAALAHPTQDFTIVDYSQQDLESTWKTPKPLPNALGLVYQTNQDAFLGGYLAAAMSKTGAVGEFGGDNIPTVTIYMDGWVAGVRYYDKLNNAHVKVLGWTPTPGRPKGSLAGSGLFTNSFTNVALGNTYTRTLIGEGADIIFSVAGGVGVGAAQAVKAAGPGHYMEWVDTDGCVSDPTYCSLFITSVTKGIVASVSAAVLEAAHGMFHGGNYSGTLANNGVSLAPFHDFNNVVPASVKAELAKIKAGIVAGTISVDPNSYPAM